MKSIDKRQIDQLPGVHIGRGDSFAFSCHSHLDCFNTCCKNLNLFLYPFDVIRLKHHLNISSEEFIDRYVDIVLRKDNCFPDVLLKMSESKENLCPFLCGKGCMVYPHRPHTCRAFPMESGLMHNPVKKNGESVFFFRPPAFCKGQKESVQWTPTAYLKDQHALLYQRMTLKWAEIKGLFLETPWKTSDVYGAKGKMAFMATYNIDSFRRFIFNSSFLSRYEIKPLLLERIKSSDLTLLNFGMEWVKHIAFEIRTPSIRVK